MAGTQKMGMPLQEVDHDLQMDHDLDVDSGWVGNAVEG